MDDDIKSVSVSDSTISREISTSWLIARSDKEYCSQKLNNPNYTSDKQLRVEVVLPQVHFSSTSGSNTSKLSHCSCLPAQHMSDATYPEFHPYLHHQIPDDIDVQIVSNTLRVVYISYSWQSVCIEQITSSSPPAASYSQSPDVLSRPGTLLDRFVDHF